MRRQTAVCFSGFLLLTLLAPFFFGAVHRWAQQSLAAVLFLLFAWGPPAWENVVRLPRYFRISCAVSLGWVCIQTLFWAVDSSKAWSELLLWFSLAGAFLLVQEFDAKEIRFLIQVIIASALFQALYGYWQTTLSAESVLWIQKTTHVGYLTGTYLNRNHCAGFLELALGGALGLFLDCLESSKKKEAAVYGLIFMVLLAAILKTGSRFGVFSWCVVFSFFLVWNYFKKPHWRLPLGVLVMGVILTAIFQGTVLLQRFNYEEGFMAPVSGRVWVWQDMSAVFSDYGLWGLGLGGFERIFPQYQSARLMMGWDHAHQDYLELALILGVPMSVIWFSGWLSLAFKTVKKIKEGRPFKGLSVGLCLGLLSFILHGFADFNFAIASNAFMWIMLAACVQRMSTLGWGEPSKAVS